MITFDRVKVVSPFLGVVTDLVADHYEVVQKGKNDIQWYYKSKYSDTLPLPFDLYVKIDHIKNELVLELPAKLLADNYPDLISLTNISEIIENLDKVGLITIDFMQWFKTAHMLAVDVTVDYNVKLEEKDYEYIKNLILNPNKWGAGNYFNGIEILSNNKTRNRKSNMKIYGKYNELLLDRNREFLMWVGDGFEMANGFIDKTRVELELRSFEMLRKYFKTKDSSLKSILESEEKPLELILREFIEVDVSSATGDYLVPLIEMKTNQAKEYLVLERCDFNLERVYYFLKQTMSKKSKPKLALKRYREIFVRIEEQKQNPSKEKVLKLIGMIAH